MKPKTNMDLALSKLFSLDVRILIQELVYMLDLMIHTLNLVNYLIKLLKTITDTKKEPSILVIWTTLN